MINFSDELKKYRPILEIDDIEDSIHSNEIKDMLDILTYLSQRGESEKK